MIAEIEDLARRPPNRQVLSRRGAVHVFPKTGKSIGRVFCRTLQNSAEARRRMMVLDDGRGREELICSEKLAV